MSTVLTKEMKGFPKVHPLPGFLSGSTLKLIATLIMATDHFGACVVYGMLYTARYPAGMNFEDIYHLYMILRGIGRTAFPIFAFLLIEGLLHTHSKPRYLISLVIFSAISELPFDLVATETISDPFSLDIPRLIYENRQAMMEHQNVFFTLSLGLAAAWLTETFRKRYGVCLLTFLIAIPATLGTAWLADIMKTDYGGIGVLTILAFYFLYPVRIAAAGCSYLILSRLYLEGWGFPGYLLTLVYNGKRGFIGHNAFAKYFFYFFYPAHLFFLFLLRVWVLNAL